MVDIHSHVLWGLDDGARSFEQSLEMLRISAESGVTDIVATPHSNAEYTYSPDLIREKIAQLRESGAPMPELHTGCDFHLSFENLDRALQHPSQYSIAGRQYILVECPDFRVGPETETVLARLLDTGLIPIVTHPERNPVLQNNLERLTGWVNLGCLMQVTAMSITGGFGRSAIASATELLKRDLVHVVASDAHDPAHRTPRMTEAYQRVKQLRSAATAQTLFFSNPASVIKGDPIAVHTSSQSRPPRKWWSFLR